MVKCVFDKAAVLECRWLKVFEPSAITKQSASSRSFTFCFCNIWLCDLSFNSYNLLKCSHANLNIVSIHNLTLLSQPHFWFVRTFFSSAFAFETTDLPEIDILEENKQKKNYQQNAFNQSRLAKSYFVFCFVFFGGVCSEISSILFELQAVCHFHLNYSFPLRSSLLFMKTNMHVPLSKWTVRKEFHWNEYHIRTYHY